MLFIWFAALKLAGASPVAAIVSGTLPFADPTLTVLVLGGVELELVAVRLVLPVLAAHLTGTFLTFVMLPELMFRDGNPLLLTEPGELVVKNLVLIGATLVLMVHTRTEVRPPSPLQTQTPPSPRRPRQPGAPHNRSGWRDPGPSQTSSMPLRWAIVAGGISAMPSGPSPRPPGCYGYRWGEHAETSIIGRWRRSTGRHVPRVRRVSPGARRALAVGSHRGQPRVRLSTRGQPPLSRQSAAGACVRTGTRIVDTLVGLLRRWLSQDVARTNAAQASVRLQHRRRELEDVDAFLAARHHRPPRHPSDSWSRHTGRGSSPGRGRD
jgi:hypothetical protein